MRNGGPGSWRSQADKIQAVYDKVLHDGRGKGLDDVRRLLAEEWRSALGSDLTEPRLQQRAAELAAETRVEVNLDVVP
jgi:hypothetical protein